MEGLASSFLFVDSLINHHSLEQVPRVVVVRCSGVARRHRIPHPFWPYPLHPQVHRPQQIFHKRRGARPSLELLPVNLVVDWDYLGVAANPKPLPICLVSVPALHLLPVPRGDSLDPQPIHKEHNNHRWAIFSVRNNLLHPGYLLLNPHHSHPLGRQVWHNLLH